MFLVKIPFNFDFLCHKIYLSKKKESSSMILSEKEMGHFK